MIRHGYLNLSPMYQNISYVSVCFRVTKMPTAQDKLLWSVFVYCWFDCPSTPLNNFSYETPGPIFFKFHLKVYKAYSNDDPRLTFHLFIARSNLGPYAFVWGKYWKFSFSKCIKDQWLKLKMYDQCSKPFQLQSKFFSQGYLPLPLGYIHV